MKKLPIVGLVLSFAVSGALGLACLQTAETVWADENAMQTENTATVEMSTTKIKKSKDLQYLLIATAIKNPEDVYEVGYDFHDTYEIQETDNTYTDKYFTSLVTDAGTETVEDIFGVEYADCGMIVWEVAYNPAEAISYTAYALVGIRDDEGELLRPTDPANEVRVEGTKKEMSVHTTKVIFVDGDESVERTATFGVGLNGEIPAFTGTPNEGKEFFWALEDGTVATATDFTALKTDITVTKTERTIINSVRFDGLNLSANYFADGYEYASADGNNALENVNLPYGEDISFGVLVGNDYNQSIADVKYVFHNTETGESHDFVAEVTEGFVVYTLDKTNVGDGYVEMVGEYKENTYNATVNLVLFETWGTIDNLDDVTVTVDGETVAIDENGKATASLAKGTYEMVITEPTGKMTTVEFVIDPTSWNDCLTFAVEETVAVGYSGFTATDSNGNNRTGNYKQDVNGTIVPNSGSANVNNTIALTDYTINGADDYAVKARFTCTEVGNDSPDLRINLTNGTNTVVVGVNKMYFRVFVNGTEFKPDHSFDSAFSAGLTNSDTTPFIVDLMLVKTESKLSIYYSYGTAEENYIHYGDITAEGIKLSNGEFAHTVLTSNDITFNATVSANFTAFLGASDLKMGLITTGSKTFTKYSGFGVKTENITSAYKVEHYLQKADMSGYELRETENLTGITNTVAKAVAKSYDGYALASANKDAVLQGEIAEDGSLVLKVYYYIAKNFTAMNGTSDYTEYFDRAEDGTISATNVSYVNNTYIQLNETFDGSKDYTVNARFTYRGEATDPLFNFVLTNGTYRIYVGIDGTKLMFYIYAQNSTTSSLQLNIAHNFSEAFANGVSNAKTTPFEFDLKLEKTSTGIKIYHTIGSTDGYILLEDMTVDKANEYRTSQTSYSDAWVNNYYVNFLKATNLTCQVRSKGTGTVNTTYSNYYIMTGEEN